MEASYLRGGFSTFLFLFLSFPIFLAGQSYPLGLNPPRLKWKSIETKRVNVIYPESLEKQGQYVTNLVHHLWDSNYYSLGPKKEKVSIILQNQNTVSNGFVSVGPFRSEFYMTPPQYNFLGNVNWLTGLTIHEYRHVEQFVNAKRSITKIGSLLFGQNGWGATAGLALPRWFFEGDAVFYETALTAGGRGRMANFENQQKALLLSGKKIPKYELASATSLKRLIPNHYNLGYYMVTGMRRDFGDSVVQEVVDKAVGYNSIFFPFSMRLKKLTGYRTPKYYKKLTHELYTKWSVEDSLRNPIAGKPVLSKAKKAFTHYTNSTLLNDSTLIAYKAGFRDIPHIVLIDLNTGKESKLVEPGFIPRSNATLSTNGKFLVWSQTGFHHRWGNLDFSEIWGYDLINEQLVRITEKSRYFTPAINKTGDKIAAVHITKSQEEKLVVLNSVTKEEEFSYQFSNGDRAAFPIWADQEKIFFILQKATKNALAFANISTGDVIQISPGWNGVMAYPAVKGAYIYFNANFSGIDNIYRWDIEKQQLEVVTNSRFGAVQPLIVDQKLYVSDYSNDGYGIKAFELLPKPIAFDSIENKANFYEPAVTSPALLALEQTAFESKKFNQSKGLVNVHSWTPFFLPPNLNLTLESDNLLSTFSGDFNYSYNTNEKTSTYSMSATYGRFFPALEVNISKGNRSRYVPVLSQEEENLLLNINNQGWNEEDLNVGITLPLNTTWNNYFSTVRITQAMHRKRVIFDQKENTTGTDEIFHSYSFDLSAYFLKRRALQHLNSRFGISTELAYNATIGTIRNKTQYFLFNSRLFLPGISKNHSLNISQSIKNEDYLANYKFRDNLFYTRGYNLIPHDRFINTAFNYEFPICYPDLPIGPIFFIKRINANLFYDLGQATTNGAKLTEFAQDGNITINLQNGFTKTSSVELSSVGTEITIDFRFLRVLDLNSGIRISYPINQKLARNQFALEFLLFSVGF
ncbi:MAG: hypothetical protein ACO2ZZ_06530 [Cyclobacteriaceae bacterium]